MRVVDPTYLKIDPKDKAYFLSLLQHAEKAQSGWEELQWYKTKYKNKKTDISLTNTVIKRISNKGNIRYDVIDQVALGAGGYGTVFPVTVTYKVKDNRLIEKHRSPGKRRIVKRIPFDGKTETLDKVVSEYTHANATPHLPTEYPVILGNYIYLVSRRIEGAELFEILRDDLDGTKILTLEERFDLTLNLILALKEQVSDVGLVHRDIKPENIIVDMSSGKIGTIDFGFAKFAGEEVENDSAGSATYAAPEVFLDLGTTQASDIYSLGRILGLIWHADLASYSPRMSKEQRLQFAAENNYSTDMFKNIKDLDGISAFLISRTIEYMTAFESGERCKILEAYEQICIAKKIQFPAQPMVAKEEYPFKEKKVSKEKRDSVKPNYPKPKSRKSKEKEKEKEQKQHVLFIDPGETKSNKKWGRFFHFKNKSKKMIQEKASSSKKKEKDLIQKNDENKNFDAP